MINVVEALKTLGQARPVFHSEADFQHSLAWQLHLQNPLSKIRLEYPLSGDGDVTGRLDLLVFDGDWECAIELKYKKARFWMKIENELYMLKSDSAQDQARYDFLKDVQRLEQRTPGRTKSVGYTILLKNDNLLWDRSSNQNVSTEFSLSEGKTIKGSLNWTPIAGGGTTDKRESPISLSGIYLCKWLDYSNLTPDKGKGKFRYLLFEVE
jgi:hypothetical protein